MQSPLLVDCHLFTVPSPWSSWSPHSCIPATMMFPLTLLCKALPITQHCYPCLILQLISCQLIIVAFEPCLLLCCSCCNCLQHCMTCQQEIHWCFFCLLLPLPWFTFAIAATDHGATTAVEYCQHQGHCTSINPVSPCLYFLLFFCQILHQWPMHLTLALQLPLQLPLQLSLQLPLPRQLPSIRQHNCQCCQLVDFFMFFPLFQLFCLHRSCSAGSVTVSVLVVMSWQPTTSCLQEFGNVIIVVLWFSRSSSVFSCWFPSIGFSTWKLI